MRIKIKIPKLSIKFIDKEKAILRKEILKLMVTIEITENDGITKLTWWNVLKMNKKELKKLKKEITPKLKRLMNENKSRVLE